MSQTTVLIPAPGFSDSAGPAGAPVAPKPAPRRRRRPSGEAPPLPHNLGRGGRRWVWITGGVIVTWFAVALLGAGAPVDKADHFLLERIASLRTRPATNVAHFLELIGSPERVLLTSWVVIGVALAFRRFPARSWSSTSPSPKCVRRHGARPSTWPT